MILTKEIQNERIKRCVEYLKNIGVVSSFWNHFSPYSEAHVENQGSNLHILCDETGTHRFLFNDNNDLINYQSEKLSSEASPSPKSPII